MKTIGIIGGLSWFSTSVYYRIINQLVNQKMGDSHSARIIMYSVDFNDFKTLQEKNEWNAIALMLNDIAQRLQHAGADCIVMATNTPHLVAGQIVKNIKIPLLHIAEETAKEIVKHQIRKVGLIGTKFTMEHSFFKDHLSLFGIASIIPDIDHREFIHWSVFNELTKGIFNEATKEKYLEIIEKLKNNGAEGIILGCTEISLLIKPQDTILKVFDTAQIHSTAAVDFALSS